MRARAAGQEAETVAHPFELRAERVGHARLEPADHPGAPARQDDARSPRLAQDPRRSRAGARSRACSRCCRRRRRITSCASASPRRSRAATGRSADRRCDIRCGAARAATVAAGSAAVADVEHPAGRGRAAEDVLEHRRSGKPPRPHDLRGVHRRYLHDKIGLAHDAATSTTSTSRSDGGRELLGGKGIGLAEMTQLGVPVPAGLHDHDRRLPRYMREGGAAGRPRGRDRPRTSRASRSETGKRFGDPDDPLLVSVRSGAAVSMPGMMDTILNLGLNDDAVEGPRAHDGQRALRARLVPAPDPDVRRGRRRHRRPPLRAGARRPEARARRAAGRRSRPPTTSRELVETFKAIYQRRDGRRRSRRTRASSCARAVARRLRVVGEPARAGVPAHVRDPRRPRHGRERRADGLRQQGRPLGDRRLLHARPVDGRAAASTASTS